MLLRMALPALCLLFSIPSLCQKIEAISTDAEAVAFVNGIKEEGNNYQQITLEAPGRLRDRKDYKDFIRQFGPSVFEKADLDNNGHMDLLLNGYYGAHMSPVVVLAFGNDSFQVKWLNLSLYLLFCEARLITVDHQPCIQIRQAAGKENEVDTLMYAFDDFIERSKPAAYGIKKVKYCAFGGLMPMVAFQLTITRDSVILLNDRGFNPHTAVDSGGIFTAGIDPGTITAIFELLNYMDFPTLKDRYSKGGTDQLEGDIRVTFDDGKIKRVTDYGLIGTHGLSILHSLLFELKDKQHWKKIRPVEDTFIHICED